MQSTTSAALTQKHGYRPSVLEQEVCKLLGQASTVNPAALGFAHTASSDQTLSRAVLAQPSGVRSGESTTKCRQRAVMIALVSAVGQVHALRHCAILWLHFHAHGAGGCLQSCRLYIGLATDWGSDVRSRETCRGIAFIIDSRACSFIHQMC